LATLDGGSGVLAEGSGDEIFSDGLPLRETFTFKPGGTLGAGDDGFDKLN
jgi:hypothetical protein